MAELLESGKDSVIDQSTMDMLIDDYRERQGYRTLWFDCPHCGERCQLVAKADVVHSLGCDVCVDVNDTVRPSTPFIDWESAEIDADFSYCCDSCGELVAHDLRELEKLIKEKWANIGPE